MQEIMKWAVIVVSLIGSALAMGSPVLYGATTTVLASGGKTFARLISLLCGLVLGATAMFAALQVFNPTTYIDAAKGDLDRVALNRWVDLLGGVVLLAIAALVLWQRRARPVREPKPVKEPRSTTALYSYLGLGLSCAVVGFTTWPLMFVVTRTVSAASEHILVRGVTFLVFLLAMIAPYLLLAWLWSRSPATAGRISSLYTRALAYDYRMIISVLCACAGVVLILLSLVR